MKQDPELIKRARQLRRNSTPAEKILWAILRDRRFTGIKFRRQFPCGAYILDFYCPELLVAIELDGDSHLGQEGRDRAKDRWVETQGIKMLRFWNNQVYDDRDAVLECIWNTCQERVGGSPLTPNPSPQGGEGRKQ